MQNGTRGFRESPPAKTKLCLTEMVLASNLFYLYFWTRFPAPFLFIYCKLSSQAGLGDRQPQGGGGVGWGWQGTWASRTQSLRKKSQHTWQRSRHAGTIETFYGLLPESQSQNLALTVSYVPYSLDSGPGRCPCIACGESRSTFERGRAAPETLEGLCPALPRP